MLELESGERGDGHGGFIVILHHLFPPLRSDEREEFLRAR